jgi:hypothetical protein
LEPFSVSVTFPEPADTLGGTTDASVGIGFRITGADGDEPAPPPQLEMMQIAIAIGITTQQLRNPL